ncbi:MAG: excinuclease ABC subunit UvrB [Cytophagales bacterium]|nr:MAG: excinuclease ABC subunit UvrB [Cytophagales bacterium]TAF61905.1 MAG: excinuclease ABC subunit UvrB [Cytophagales bacterium]
MAFELVSPFKPTGDQPRAIQALLDGIRQGESYQTLLGVTGSGKTFTVANVIAELNRPTLIMSHNKTLGAQLYGEFKQFFPNNAVEYFISYYDYYQPEAYIPSTGVYIEKELSINQEIEKLRLRTTASLLSGRRDVIVVASISCIYGLGNPKEFGRNAITLKKGDKISRNKLLLNFVGILYERADVEFRRGTFRVKGDTIDVFPAYADLAYRLYFWGEEIESIQLIDPHTGNKLKDEAVILLFPANLFVTGRDVLESAIEQIEQDLDAQVKFFVREGRMSEAKRIEERTRQDIEMMREVGYCSGIENYSRYFDQRESGDRPYCLFDYFPDDFLLFVDESHVTAPQARGMWGGDRSRKISLVDFGFRLPSALDNRPLTFNEFESLINQAVFVSATPADYELQKTEGVVIEQIIRPTGLLDPKIEVRPTINQLDDLLNEIEEVISTGERILVTTLTKRMAEELSKYLENYRIKNRYLHSDIKTLERVEIIRQLRLGDIDVLVGVNMLREGLDMPEVALVAILDADKEGFLRNERSLVQTIGRAARNQNGRVLMYADKITPSMEKSISETNRRRGIQDAYNKAHNITPQTVRKSREAILEQTTMVGQPNTQLYLDETEASKSHIVNDPIIANMTLAQLQKQIELTQKQMEKAAKDLDFLEAARLRDDWYALQTLREQKAKN